MIDKVLTGMGSVPVAIIPFLRYLILKNISLFAFIA